MENKDTQYKEDNNPDDFIHFLFDKPPVEPNSIKLELDPSPKTKHIGLHIFEQLLQIFVDGLKYKYSNNNKVDISRLSSDNLSEMGDYFKSIGFYIKIKIMNLNNYKKKPNPFTNHELINGKTSFNDFHFELNRNNNIYRISFDFLR